MYHNHFAWHKVFKNAELVRMFKSFHYSKEYASVNIYINKSVVFEGSGAKLQSMFNKTYNVLPNDLIAITKIVDKFLDKVCKFQAFL